MSKTAKVYNLKLNIHISKRQGGTPGSQQINMIWQETR